MSQTSTYTVTGMTCGHCVAAVTDELSRVPGVIAVDIDLAPAGRSTVAVTSDVALPRHHVAAAVEEAGYVLDPGTT